MLKEKFFLYNIMPRVFTENIVKPECQTHRKINKTRLVKVQVAEIWFQFNET